MYIQRFTVVARILLVISVLFAAPWFFTPAQPGDPVQAQAADQGLFSEVDSSREPALPNKPTIVRTRFVDVDLDLLLAPKPADTGETLELNLFTDVHFTAIREQQGTTPSGGLTWTGQLEGVALSQVVLVARDGILVGNVSMPGAFYQIRYAGDGVHAIHEIDQSAFPDELPPIPVDISQEALAKAAEAPMLDDGSTIDVLVVYTPAARSTVGGTTAMETLIDLAVTETNTSYAHSNITQRLNLVHTDEVSYVESSFSTDLNRITNPSDGYMDNVHTLRNTYAADEVVLIINDASSCGIGWLMTTVSTAFEDHAFVVVHWGCATGYYSFGHEMGHNMGAHHDWYVNSTTAPYAYNHGFVNFPDRWRTVMAYNTECSDRGGSCTRLQYWSNPNVSYGGDPMGVPAGTSTSCSEGVINPYCDADNHQVLNNTAYTVANFRASAPPPVGPLVYAAHTIDDDASGDSDGDGDGIVDCGETIELFVDLHNQGSTTAEGVSARVTTVDPYTAFLYNFSSSYANLSGGATGTNLDDYDFVVDSSAPNGHTIHFDLEITASNGGPWYDSFDVPVTCPVVYDHWFYLPIVSKNHSEPSAFTPIEEGFESNAMPPSGGWSVINTHPTRNWTITTNSSYIHSGSYAAWVNYDTLTASDEWLLTPVLDLRGVSTAWLTFWAFSDTNWCPAGGTGANMLLRVTNPAGTPIGTVWDMCNDESWASAAYREVAINLSAYTGQEIKLAWQYVGIDGQSFGLDDIYIGATTSDLQNSSIWPPSSSAPQPSSSIDATIKTGSRDKR